jgi:uncharacterized protein RhaS with RHS repeats
LVKPAAISDVDCGCSSGAGAKAFTYDVNGFLSSLTDFDGKVTTYVYNAKGQETSRTEASGTPLARQPDSNAGQHPVDRRGAVRAYALSL